MERYASRLAVILTFALLAFVMVNYLYLGLDRTFYPFEIGYDEADLYLHAMNVYEGKLHNLYKDINIEPLYQSNDYPPVYYFVCAFLFMFTGPVLWPCRMLSLVTSLGAGILVFLILRRFTKNRKLSAAAALLAFASNITFYWGSYIRNDSLVLFLTLLGLYFVTCTERKHHIKIASAFFILAFFTKQTYIAAPLACMLYFLCTDRKKLKEMLLFYIVPAVAIFIVINLLTNWQFFINIVVQNSHRVGYFRQTVFDIFAENSILIALGFVYLLVKRNIFSMFFAISLGMAMFQSLNPVGWTQYFFEMVFASAICIGLLFHEYRHDKRVKVAIFLILLVHVASVMYLHPNIHMTALEPQHHSTIRNMESDLRLLEYARNSTGNIIIEHGYMSVIAGKPMLLPELWNIVEYEFMGILKPEDFISFMVERDVTMIAFREQRFKTIPLMRGFLKDNFYLAEKVSWMDDQFNSTWEVYVSLPEEI